MKVYEIRGDISPILDELAEGGLLKVEYGTERIDIEVFYNDNDALEKKWFELEDLIALTETHSYADYSTTPTSWISEFPDDEIRVRCYNC